MDRVLILVGRVICLVRREHVWNDDSWRTTATGIRCARCESRA